MKKIVLICSMLAITSTVAFAQLPSFNLGLKAGLNLAKLQSDFTSEENRLGFQVGAWARVGGAGLYVQPEAYIGSKGSKFLRIRQDNGNEVEAEGKVRFTTLDVPLLLGTKVGPKNLNVRFMVGPVISFVLDKNTTFNSAYNQATDFEDYKNQTWGGQVGAGVDVGGITVDLRYEKGLSNISESSKYDQKSNLWHLSLGFKLL